ncbi:MAG: cysteine synthase family protein [Bacteriovoracaceae bacterium]|nr:cysteine synthase family protein [Bacteriovoracaceae bacterium]
MKITHLAAVIGRTPHLKLAHLFQEEAQKYPGQNLTCWLKLEDLNPGGSIKDRIAVAMLEDALQSKRIHPGQTIIEPTSGNTGIGLAWACAIYQLPLIIVLPDTTSLPRQKIMAAYGAQLVHTPGAQGMKAAIAKAQELAQEKDGVILDQFNNPANVKAHAYTAQEIAEDFPQLDYLICGVGTSGHLTGISQVLKQANHALQVWAVEPAESSVLSGNPPGKHGIQGIGAGIKPPFFQAPLVDRIVQVSTAAAMAMQPRLAHCEGLLGGVSTGAVLAAIREHYAEFRPGSTILTLLYDRGERYLA